MLGEFLFFYHIPLSIGKRKGVKCLSYISLELITIQKAETIRLISDVSTYLQMEFLQEYEDAELLDAFDILLDRLLEKLHLLKEEEKKLKLQIENEKLEEENKKLQLKLEENKKKINEEQFQP